MAETVELSPEVENYREEIREEWVSFHSLSGGKE
jgi:hypothetical protein